MIAITHFDLALGVLVIIQARYYARGAGKKRLLWKPLCDWLSGFLAA